MGSSLNNSEFFEELLNLKMAEKVLVLTGIARPGRFLADFRSIVTNTIGRTVTLRHVELDDHGVLSSEAVYAIQNCEILILTAKDFFRWKNLPRFCEAAKAKRVVVCVMESVMKTYEGLEIEFSSLLQFASDRRRG